MKQPVCRVPEITHEQWLAFRRTGIGGSDAYTKELVCPDGCVIFRMTATKLDHENFHTGGFWHPE